MGLISTQFPFTDVGSLQGGVREHLAVLRELNADAFRNASQSQNTDQAARAFSGATVTNENTQTEDLKQDATVENFKELTINAVSATNPNVGGFDSNYLQRFITGGNAADFLARGAANVAQEQGGGQSAFARLNDFDGADSSGNNELTQNEKVEQIFDVDILANVTATVEASLEENAYNQARFRTIESLVENQSAQSVFAVGQRQGTANAPVTQVAIADGADAANTLTQVATVEHGGGLGGMTNTIDLQGEFDLSRNEDSFLSPRTTDLMAAVKKNSAINSSSASQEQDLAQSAGGAVNGDGQTTENGKGATASNTGSSSLDNAEATFVLNSITITI